MRKTLLLPLTMMLAMSAPAFAQSAGSPGAAPAGSGSNTPGSGVQPNMQHTDENGAMNTMDNGMTEGRAAAPQTNSKMDSSERNAATGAVEQRGASGPGGGASGSGTGGGAK